MAAFVRDPADSDFQGGYLAALYVVAKEGLGMDLDAPPLPAPDQAPSWLRVVK
jgi:hypothetical protein